MQRPAGLLRGAGRRGQQVGAVALPAIRGAHGQVGRLDRVADIGDGDRADDAGRAVERDPRRARSRRDLAHRRLAAPIRRSADRRSPLGDAGVALLHDVGELVGDEVLPCSCRRAVLPTGEEDVTTARERTRLHLVVQRASPTVGVDPYGREVRTEAVLHRPAHAGVERRTAAAHGGDCGCRVGIDVASRRSDRPWHRHRLDPGRTRGPSDGRDSIGGVRAAATSDEAHHDVGEAVGLLLVAVAGWSHDELALRRPAPGERRRLARAPVPRPACSPVRHPCGLPLDATGTVPFGTAAARLPRPRSATERPAIRGRPLGTALHSARPRLGVERFGGHAITRRDNRSAHRRLPP